MFFRRSKGLQRGLPTFGISHLGIKEAPFFGPNSDDVFQKNMIVNVDVSFFGHPTLHGLRVETCYVITENGAEPLCPAFEQELFNYVEKH